MVYTAPPWRCPKTWGEGAGGKCAGVTETLKDFRMTATDPKPMLSWELRLRTCKESSIIHFRSQEPLRWALTARVTKHPSPQAVRYFTWACAHRLRLNSAPRSPQARAPARCHHHTCSETETLLCGRGSWSDGLSQTACDGNPSVLFF